MNECVSDRRWVGVSEHEFARLLRRGRVQGWLGIDEIIEVLYNAELSPELISEVLQALGAEGIQIDETVVEEDNKVALRLLRPRQRLTQKRDHARLSTTGISPADSTNIYLQKIGEVPLLSAEQEVELGNAIRLGNEAESELADLAVSGDLEQINRLGLVRLRRRQRAGEVARDRLTRANLRLVVSIAKRYVGRGLQLLDLVQEGNLGLMRAVERFDPNKGFRFSTYATWWIRQSVARAIANQARSIRIPAHTVDALNQCVRVQNELQDELKRLPTTSEIASRSGLEPEKIEQLLDLARTQEVVSLDSPLAGENGSKLSDLLADLEAEDGAVVTVRGLLKDDVLDLLEQLDERERDILQMRFGLGDVRPATLEEVGKRFGVTRERVRQVESRILAKLRNPGRSAKLREYLEGN